MDARKVLFGSRWVTSNNEVHPISGTEKAENPQSEKNHKT